jgi:predicted permease
MNVVDRYLEELRDELAVQFRAADIERIVEEVEGHLLAAIEERGASDDEQIAEQIAAFGSPAVVGSSYRKTGIRSIEGRADASGASGAPSTNFLDPPRTASRIRIGDLMNFSQIFRNLIRNPGFAAVTIATLALGIGANAVILSVVNGILLKPLPFPDADRLVRLYHSAPALLEMDDIGLSQNTYFYYRDEGLLEDLAIYQQGAGNLSGGEEPRRVDSLSVSHSFFDVLGIPPLLGRSFNEADEAPGAPHVIILSEPLWRTSFGAREDVIGETVSLDSETVEIVGVMPDTVTFPEPWTGLYEPMTLSREFRALGSLGINSVGRMPPGMTVDALGALAAARLTNLEDTFPDEPAAPILARGGFTAHARSLQDVMVGDDIERTIWLLMGSVGFILLIACANVANVFLVRAEGREREMAIRAAMGAGRGRLALSYLAESAVLGLISGGVGLLLALAGVRALLRFAPEGTPRVQEIGIDGTVALATLAIALLAGLLFGIIPVLRYNAKWLAAALKEGGRANTAGRARFHMRSLLVAAQVALALVLLVGSGLMVRSYWTLSSIDPGFDADSVLTFRLALNQQDYPSDEDTARFIQRVMDSVSEMPGVVDVGASNALPLAGNMSGQGYAFEDFPLGEGDLPPVHVFKYVSPNYFETLRIGLLAGRTFERADYEERRGSVIVNQSFARRYWPDQDPLGRRIQPGGGAEPNPDLWYSIIGVVDDVRGNGSTAGGGDQRGGLEVDPAPVIYLPLEGQQPTDADGNPVSPWVIRNPMFAVRTSGSPTALLDPIRRRIWDMDPNLPISGVFTMNELIDRAMVQRSFTMLLLLAGSTGALLIGAVGIYGVISYLVAQQTREIGVRMALGAQTRDIGRMVLRRSLLITVGGIVVGIAGAAFLTRAMTSLLFGVSPIDPTTFAAVVVTLLAVASLAAYLPARRAAHVDPMEALRRE